MATGYGIGVVPYTSVIGGQRQCLRFCLDRKSAPADTREPGQFTSQTLSQRFRHIAKRAARFGDLIW